MLCNRSIQFVLKRDKHRKFRFATLQSLSDEPNTDMDSLIYLRNGQKLERSTGALNILRDLGGPWKAFYIFIVIPEPIRDRIYSFIAVKRYAWFGRKDFCMVPTPDVSERFIDRESLKSAFPSL